MKSKPAAAPTHYGLEVRYTLRAFTRAFTRINLPIHITAAEFRLMRPLGEGKLYTQSELADIAALDRPYVTSLIRKLINRGLVATSANPADRRRIDLRLSKQGQRIYERIWRELAMINSTAVKGISKADLAKFVTVLQRIRSNLDDVNE